jgi:Protein of unknown function (DUF2877)
VAARLRALRRGAGAAEALASEGEGRVLAWFPKACYVEGPGGLVTLVGPDAHDGPLYLALDEDVPRTEPGAPARLSSAAVELPGCTVVAEGAEPWHGALPDPERVRSAADAISQIAGQAAAGALLPRAGIEARPLVERGDLEGAAALLAGLGPGLTPSGDDALGGVLFAVRAAGGASLDVRLASVADSVRTNSIARAFLRWAARGQALAPVHDLIQAGVEGDIEAGRAAAQALAAVGESSGADFALGLRWGMFSALSPGLG